MDRSDPIDPITAEIIKSSLIYASEEMGIAVRNSAYSPNIKERLDHSCALFDSAGRLIAQAEHIPVHLGSLPWGLRTTLDVIQSQYGAVKPGEMWVVNDPYVSGTHLNDVTVIRPIFYENGLVAFAANKAHHTDVGGSVPGSMSADAGDLFAEGLIVPPCRLVRNDRAVTPIVELFRANSRSAESRSGDLRAQMAGNYTGERRMLELYKRYGTRLMQAAIDRALRDSEVRMRHELSTLRAGSYRYEDVLEDLDGNPSICIAVTMTIQGGEVHFDYTGTAAQVSFPMNAVYGVTLSGVYYALRAVTDPTIPMNDGCFRPVTVHVPPGTLLNPRRPAPVSGGNVETSTRNADVVFGALAQAAPRRVPAQSGGTMSNVMIGGTRSDGSTWAFYETNGCGMGGRPGMDGIDAIQCHMTNTLNTPIEAIERDYPLRVDRYEIAENTGGAGRYRGGCGLIRSLRLTDGTARISLLAERHVRAPQGAQGGANGQCGRHVFIPRGEQPRNVPAKTTRTLQPGDAIEIHTPGGGGYGLGEGDDKTNGTERGVGEAGSGDGDVPGA